MTNHKYLYRPMLSVCFLLTACQSSPVLRSNQMPTNILQESQAAGIGQLQITSNSQFSQVSFLPEVLSPQGFNTQALRRSDIKHYRMTITLPGDASGRATGNVAANADGTLAAPLTLNKIPVGNFRVIMIQAFNGVGDEITNLRAGHVFNTRSNADFNVTLTRQAVLLAETIQHFTNSVSVSDLAIFNVWKQNSAQILTDLSTLISNVLASRDPLSLKSSTLIAAIQAKIDGTLPTADLLDANTSSGLTLSYKVPVGYMLLVNTVRLSLNTATSAVTEELPAQQAGSQSFDIPDVYLPVSGTQTMTMRLLGSANQILLTQELILTPNGIQAGTPGSATNPLLLPTSFLDTAQAGLTFYLDSIRPDNTGDGSATTTAWQTLSHALAQLKTKYNNGDFGDNVPVLVMAAGEYGGEVTVDFPIQIIGAGNGNDTSSNTVIKGAATGTGLILSGTTTTDSKRIQLEGLQVTNFLYGFQLSGNHISLNQIAANLNTSIGLRVADGDSVSDLKIDGSQFNGNTGPGIVGGIGLYFSKGTANSTNCTEIEIKDTQFNQNRVKGIYIEKISNALFDRIEVKQSGIASDYGFNAGIDINLKGNTAGANPGSSYENITIQNSVISESGVLGTASERKFPVAVCIKARDDASSYNGRPANLSNVQIINTLISGPVNALRFGEPTKNNLGPSGVVISKSQLSLEGTDASSRYALLNITQAGIDASDGNTFNGLTISEDNAFGIESAIFDKIENSIHGRVDLGLGTDQIYLPFQADASHIQAAINAAQAGDTIRLQAGTYIPAQSLTINVNKDITLRGNGTSTLFQRSVSSAPPNLFNLSATGATLSHMAIQKMEKTGEDNLVYLGANNLTAENMTFTGAYVSGDSEVSRAMIGQAGITGLLIQNNRISGLRQPGYFSGATTLTGQILNNTVFGTRGWVTEGAMITFTGNTWRSDNAIGASGNFGCDIALLRDDLSPVPATYLAFYNDIAALEAANSSDLLATVGSGMGDCDQRNN